MSGSHKVKVYKRSGICPMSSMDMVTYVKTLDNTLQIPYMCEIKVTRADIFLLHAILCLCNITRKNHPETITVH